MNGKQLLDKVMKVELAHRSHKDVLRLREDLLEVEGLLNVAFGVTRITPDYREAVTRYDGLRSRPDVKKIKKFGELDSIRRYVN